MYSKKAYPLCPCALVTPIHTTQTLPQHVRECRLHVKLPQKRGDVGRSQMHRAKRPGSPLVSEVFGEFHKLVLGFLEPILPYFPAAGVFVANPTCETKQRVCEMMSQSARLVLVGMYRMGNEVHGTWRSGHSHTVKVSGRGTERVSRRAPFRQQNV